MRPPEVRRRPEAARARGLRAARGARLLAVLTAILVLKACAGPERQDPAPVPASVLESTSAGRSELPAIPRIDLDDVDPGFAETVSGAVAAATAAPGSAEAVGGLGRVYQRNRYLDQARRAYARAEALDPSAPAWPYYLGYLAAQRGAHAEAAAHFERVLALDPGYWPARIRLGDVFLAQDDVAAAEQAFRLARAAAPRSLWPHLGLGKAARRRDDREAAARHLEAALALEPDQREARYLLAMTERKSGRAERALELLRDLEDLEAAQLTDPLLVAVYSGPATAPALVRRGTERLEAGDYPAAERLYREALELDSRSYDAHLNLGVVYGLLDRNREAALSLEQAIRLDPGRADAYALLTIAYIKTGRAAEAIVQLEKALEIDPEHPRAREILHSIGGSPPAPQGPPDL